MKKALCFAAFACAVFLAEAKSFSLQVIQKNAPGDSVFEASYVVEQTVLDYFFERGMIVSNSAILLSKNDEAEDKTELHRAMMEARIGSMDLFVKLALSYSAVDSANPSAVLLSNIEGADIEIISLGANKTLSAARMRPPSVTERNNNRGGVEGFANDIAKKIQAELAERGGEI